MYHGKNITEKGHPNIKFLPTDLHFLPVTSIWRLGSGGGMGELKSQRGEIAMHGENSKNFHLSITMHWTQGFIEVCGQERTT